MNLWDDLPNAKHIDWVLASIDEHLDEYAACERPPVSDQLLANRAVVLLGRGNVAACLHTVVLLACKADTPQWDAHRYSARVAMWGAARALCAYDHCGEYLSWPVKAVEGVAALGDPAATLLLPAVRVKSRVVP